MVPVNRVSPAPPTSHSRRRWLVRLPALAAAVLTACSPPAPPRELRVGINVWPGYEFATLARDKGFYEAEGVTVRIVEFASLTDVRRAYERGQIDGMFSTVFEVIQARQDGDRAPRIVGVTDFSNGADVILVDPAVGSLRALKGRRIGLELGTFNVYVLLRGLQSAGLALGDVELVNLDPARIPDALHRGEIQAVVSYPPASLQLVRDRPLRPVFSSADIPREVVDVLSFDETLMKDRPDDIRRFLRAYARAQQYAADHVEESYGLMARRERVSVSEFRAALETGLMLVGASEQPYYLAPGGALERIVGASVEALRASTPGMRPVVPADVIAQSLPSIAAAPDGTLAR